MPYADAGTRLWYDRRGDGDPLLWVTGFAISQAILEPILPLYAERFTCISYDPRGAGRSAAPLRPTTMAQFAAEAVRLLDALGIERAHVYGLSWGGIVAQEIAIRFPDRVGALVLGGAPAVGFAAPRLRPAQLPALGTLGAGMLAAWTVRDTRLLERVLVGPQFRREQPERTRELLRLLTAHRPAPHGLLGQALATGVHDTASRLGRIRAPTLVVRGERDALVSRATARQVADRISGARAAEVADSGHLYVHERPDEALRLVTDFLAADGGLPPPGRG